MKKTESIIIIGASHGGIACAERLRKLGFGGKITLIDRLAGLPLERPPLSKQFLLAAGDADDSGFLLRSADWFGENGLDLMAGVGVASIDVGAKTLLLDTGKNLAWDKLVLATGARPRVLELGALSVGDAEGVVMLRHGDDARALRARLQEAGRVVIIGGGYIGLEVAARARKLGKSVVVLEAAARLLARVASVEASAFFAELHQSQGVDVRCDQQIAGVDSGRIVFADGDALDADLVVVGIGVIPNTELAEAAGLAVGNGILTDRHYRTSHGGVFRGDVLRGDIFAIGDVALAADGYTRGGLRLESVHHAQMSADIAAACLVGETPPVHEVPWFWSEQYDIRLQSAGLVPPHAQNSQTITRHGRREGQISFWSFAQDGALAAVEALGDAQAYMVGRQLLEKGAVVAPEVIGDSAIDLKTLIKG